MTSAEHIALPRCRAWRRALTPALSTGLMTQLISRLGSTLPLGNQPPEPYRNSP